MPTPEPSSRRLLVLRLGLCKTHPRFPCSQLGQEVVLRGSDRVWLCLSPATTEPTKCSSSSIPGPSGKERRILTMNLPWVHPFGPLLKGKIDIQNGGLPPNQHIQQKWWKDRGFACLPPRRRPSSWWKTLDQKSRNWALFLGLLPLWLWATLDLEVPT